MNERVMEGIPADQYELYAEFGMTAEKAQVLELAAGNVALSFVGMFVDTNKITAGGPVINPEGSPWAMGSCAPFIAALS